MNERTIDKDKDGNFISFETIVVLSLREIVERLDVIIKRLEAVEDLGVR